jgi:hypothetical protein
MTALAATGTDDDMGFVFQILRAYQGQQTTHEVVKELVSRLREDDRMACRFLHEQRMETGVLNDRIAERVRVKNRAFAERPALRARQEALSPL